MKPVSIITRLSVFILILGLYTFSAVAQEEKPDYTIVTGEWEISMEGRNGNTMTNTWKIELKEDKLVASIPMGMGRRGGGGGQPTTIEVNEVTFDGKMLSFEIEREGRMGTMTIGYSAEVKDGKIKGTIAMGDRFTRDFTGVKKK